MKIVTNQSKKGNEMRIFLQIDELKFCLQNKIIDPHRVYLLESMDIPLSIMLFFGY